MKIAFYGGQTAGMIVLLALKATNQQVAYVIPDDDKIRQTAQLFSVPIVDREQLNTPSFIERLKADIDLFICCHGWKILSREFVTTINCINFHPCLYRYKGLHPIRRLIADKNSKASVAVHRMTEKIDEGEVIVELFKTIEDIGHKTEADVYNELYPLYIKALYVVLNAL